jgi:general secretion pathway protein D
VIGGLVRDNVVLNERKIPLLGDIPFLGWFFKSQIKAVEKLILLVFITPHIIRDETDMVELNVRKAVEVETLQRENRIEDPTKLKQQVIEHLERNGPQSLPHNGVAKEGEAHRDSTPSGVGR